MNSQLVPISGGKVRQTRDRGKEFTVGVGGVLVEVAERWPMMWPDCGPVEYVIKTQSHRREDRCVTAGWHRRVNERA